MEFTILIYLQYKDRCRKVVENFIIISSNPRSFYKYGTDGSLKKICFPDSDSNGTFGKPSPLVRPLPWVLFLPMLLIMRVVRASLNLAAVFVGMDNVKPTTIVRYLQIRRRRIRALKFQGLRRMLHRKPEKHDEPTTWSRNFLATVSRAFCISYQHNDTSEKIIATRDSDSPVSPN